MSLTQWGEGAEGVGLCVAGGPGRWKLGVCQGSWRDGRISNFQWYQPGWGPLTFLHPCRAKMVQRVIVERMASQGSL